jgi:3-hydroxybutyryl-CoA dehydrogenase
MLERCGVLGGGQMGRGIAQVCAQAGLLVQLADLDRRTAQAARAQVGDAMERLCAKGKLLPDACAAAMERIVAVDVLADCDIAIEAVSEREDLKAHLLADLDARLGPRAILASNTSSISITRLGAATKRADRVIGLHFMNPVPVMQLVEVIRGQETSDATLQAVSGLAARLGKVVVTAQDYPGFIVNRVLMPMINEAAFALMEGVASAADIDTAMKLGTNQPMGPLALADFIGLDTCLSILEVLHAGLGDDKYRPCPLLRRLVDAGRLGRKDGAGFHSY